MSKDESLNSRVAIPDSVGEKLDGEHFLIAR
jgi:hypothetical protein